MMGGEYGPHDPENKDNQAENTPTVMKQSCNLSMHGLSEQVEEMCAIARKVRNRKALLVFFEDMRLIKSVIKKWGARWDEMLEAQETTECNFRTTAEEILLQEKQQAQGGNSRIVSPMLTSGSKLKRCTPERIVTPLGDASNYSRSPAYVRSPFRTPGVTLNKSALDEPMSFDPSVEQPRFNRRLSIVEEEVSRPSDPQQDMTSGHYPRQCGAEPVGGLGQTKASGGGSSMGRAQRTPVPTSKANETAQQGAIAVTKKVERTPRGGRGHSAVPPNIPTGAPHREVRAPLSARRPAKTPRTTIRTPRSAIKTPRAEQGPPAAGPARAPSHPANQAKTAPKTEEHWIAGGSSLGPESPSMLPMPPTVPSLSPPVPPLPQQRPSPGPQPATTSKGTATVTPPRAPPNKASPGSAALTTATEDKTRPRTDSSGLRTPRAATSRVNTPRCTPSSARRAVTPRPSTAPPRPSPLGTPGRGGHSTARGSPATPAEGHTRPELDLKRFPSSFRQGPGAEQLQSVWREFAPEVRGNSRLLPLAVLERRLPRIHPESLALLLDLLESRSYLGTRVGNGCVYWERGAN